MKGGTRMAWWEIAAGLLIFALLIAHGIVQRKLRRRRRGGPSEHR